MSETTLDEIISQRLSRDQAVVDVDEEQVKLVIFALQDSLFAFPGENIREIIPDMQIYFVPGCPHALEGVINLRGDIESVIRLQEVLGLPTTRQPHPSLILLGQGERMRSGIRVDRVIDVLDLPRSAIRAAPVNTPESLRPLLGGVLDFQQQAVSLLNLDAVFSRFLHDQAA